MPDSTTLTAPALVRHDPTPPLALPRRRFISAEHTLAYHEGPAFRYEGLRPHYLRTRYRNGHTMPAAAGTAGDILHEAMK
jgi:hypothetical protein